MKKLYLMNFLFGITTTISMSILPIFAQDNLGLSLFIIGLIEGSTEFISKTICLVSGNLFDKCKNKKLLFITPAFIALFSKILMLIPSSLGVFLSKMLERVSNGMFSAPRDAYVAFYSSKENKGNNISKLNAYKCAGCIMGPVLVFLYVHFIGSFKENVYLILIGSVFINCLCLYFAFKINTKALEYENKNKFRFDIIKEAFKDIRTYLFIFFIFYLSRFNDGTLALCLKKNGFYEGYYILTIAIFNTASFIISPYLGMIVDNDRAFCAMKITMISMIFCNLSFIFVNSNILATFMSLIGLIMWGIQRAGSQIVFSYMIFKCCKPTTYGTAMGLFGLACGTGTMIASAISGKLAIYNFNYVFLYSFTMAFISLKLGLMKYSIKIK